MQGINLCIKIIKSSISSIKLGLISNVISITPNKIETKLLFEDYLCN